MSDIAVAERPANEKRRFTPADLKTMTLENIAEHLGVPSFNKFHAPYATFRRTDAKQVERFNPSLQRMEKVWEFTSGKQITLRQEIQVKFHGNSHPQTVTIQVNDYGRPKFTATGAEDGFHPRHLMLSDTNGDFRAKSPYFTVSEADVYYYLMLCEYNSFNTEQNGRRRKGSSIPPCFELYDSEKENELAMKERMLRRKAEGAPLMLSELDAILLLRRYGKSDKDARTFDNLSHDHMCQMLSLMAAEVTDLSKDRVAYDKMIRDTGEKSLAMMLKVVSAEEAGIIQYVNKTKTWHLGTTVGGNFQKAHVIGTFGEQFGHTDKYDALIEHLQSHPEDMAHIGTAPKYKGRPSIADFMKQEEEPLTPEEKAAELKALLNSKGIRPSGQFSHARGISLCEENNIEVPEHLR